jgi:ABC-type nickel/cobalt efflux system permease component RcnA
MNSPTQYGNNAVPLLSLLALLMLISHSISNQDFSLYKLCIAAIACLGLLHSWQSYSRKRRQSSRPLQSQVKPSYRWHCRDCDQTNHAKQHQCTHCGLHRDNGNSLISQQQKPLAGH